MVTGNDTGASLPEGKFVGRDSNPAHQITLPEVQTSGRVYQTGGS